MKRKIAILLTLVLLLGWFAVAEQELITWYDLPLGATVEEIKSILDERSATYTLEGDIIVLNGLYNSAITDQDPYFQSASLLFYEDALFTIQCQSMLSVGYSSEDYEKFGIESIEQAHAHTMHTWADWFANMNTKYGIMDAATFGKDGDTSNWSVVDVATLTDEVVLSELFDINETETLILGTIKNNVMYAMMMEHDEGRLFMFQIEMYMDTHNVAQEAGA